MYDARVTAIEQRFVLGILPVLVFVQLSAGVPQARPQSTGTPHSFALGEGDTVVFYGDSITAQHFYTRLAEDFVLTRYPKLHVRFFNAGVPGDTAFGGYAGAMGVRVERDVARYHPSMITVMLGMNDGGYGYTSLPLVISNFDKGYGDLLAALHKAAPEATLTLINPTTYDEITHGTEFPGYAAIVDRLSSEVSRVEAQRQDDKPPVLRADASKPMTQALLRAKTGFPELAPLLIPDRIHPTEVAHWIIAAALLQAWNVDPVVSRVALDGGKLRVVASERTAISDLRPTTLGLQWSQLDEALPLPLDFNNAMTKVLLAVSNVEQVDQELLQVDGLREGQYQLFIDAKPIGMFSVEQLRKGVNLAVEKTPMLEQARGIDFAEERRATLDTAKFILRAEVKESLGTAAAEAELSRAESEFEKTAREKATPKAHAFELRRR